MNLDNHIAFLFKIKFSRKIEIHSIYGGISSLMRKIVLDTVILCNIHLTFFYNGVFKDIWKCLKIKHGCSKSQFLISLKNQAFRNYCHVQQNTGQQNQTFALS